MGHFAGLFVFNGVAPNFVSRESRKPRIARADETREPALTLNSEKQ